MLLIIGVTAVLALRTVIPGALTGESSPDDVVPHPSPSPALVAAEPSKPQAFLLTKEDAYIRFDPDTQTWVLGNAKMEESFVLGVDGDLQAAAVTDRTNDRVWSVSNSTVSLRVDGISANNDAPANLGTGLKLLATSATQEADGSLGLVVQLTHAKTGQELTLEQRIRPGLPIIERRMTESNRWWRAVRIIPRQNVSLRLLSAGNPTWESTTITVNGVLSTTEIARGQGVVAQAARASGAPEQYVPYIVVRNANRQEGVVAGLRWSTNWSLSAGLDNDGTLQIGGSPRLGDKTESSLLLRRGETSQAPWTILGFFAGDLDDAARLISSYIDASGATRPAWAALPPVTWNSWFAYLRDVDEQRLRAEADLAAQLGVEVFYVDYGWSAKLGDWQPDPSRFPSGLAALADYVHAKGMRFGLWVAFGAAAPDSTLVRQHPEFLARQPEPAAVGIDGSQVLCLTQSEQWIKSELDRIVRDYHVDWLKFDQPMIAACTDETHGHGSSIAASLYANNQAFYRIIDKIRSDYPNLFVENCFNGAGYLDFGSRQYTHATWLTDDSGQPSVAMPLIQQDFFGATYAFRPDFLVQWLAAAPNIPAAIGRTTSVRDLSYQAYSTMGGSWGLSLRLTEMDEEQRSLLARLIAQYKTVRPLIARGNLYHLAGPAISDNPFGGGWMAVEYHEPSSDQGALLFARNGEDASPELDVQLRGLASSAVYRVWYLDNEDSVQLLTGQELMDGGLRLAAEPRQGGWVMFEPAR